MERGGWKSRDRRRINFDRKSKKDIASFTKFTVIKGLRIRQGIEKN